MVIKSGNYVCVIVWNQVDLKSGGKEHRWLRGREELIQGWHWFQYFIKNRLKKQTESLEAMEEEIF
jgi:hypothetical protein